MNQFADSTYYGVELPERTANQFSEDPVFMALINLLADSFDTSKDMTDYMARTFNLDECEGVWADLMGRIVGISRVIPFAHATQYFGFESQAGGNAFGQERMRRAGDPIGDSVTLPDLEYRAVMRAKAVKNSGQCTKPGIVASIFALSGSPNIEINNTGNASVQVIAPGFDSDVIEIIQRLELTSEAAGINVVLESTPLWDDDNTWDDTLIWRD